MVGELRKRLEKLRKMVKAKKNVGNNLGRWEEP